LELVVELEKKLEYYTLAVDIVVTKYGFVNVAVVVAVVVAEYDPAIQFGSVQAELDSALLLLARTTGLLDFGGNP
jgi:hypothetical protein